MARARSEYRGFIIEVAPSSGRHPVAIVRTYSGEVVHESVGVGSRTVADAREAAQRWVARRVEGMARTRDYSAAELREIERRRKAAKSRSRDRVGRFGR